MRRHNRHGDQKGKPSFGGKIDRPKPFNHKAHHKERHKCENQFIFGDEAEAGHEAEADGIAKGVTAIVKAIHAKSPATKVLLLAVFPRGEKPNAQREKLAKVNQTIAKLDDGKSVKLHPGDVLIQRGTSHGWKNEGAVPCRLAVVLIDGTPKRAGSVAGAEQAR